MMMTARTTRLGFMTMLGGTPLLAGCSSGPSLPTTPKVLNKYTSELKNDGTTLTILVLLDGRPTFTPETTEHVQRATDLITHRSSQRAAPRTPTLHIEACLARPRLTVAYENAGRKLQNDTLALVAAIGATALADGLTAGLAFFAGIGVLALHDIFDQSSNKYFALQAQLAQCNNARF